MSKMAKALEKTKNHILLLGIIFIIVFVVINLFNKPVVEKYSYPEEEYQILEAEITKIIENEDFVSGYDYTTMYNSEENIYTIKIEGQKASVTAEIKNYGQDTQSFSIKRAENKKQYEEIQNKLDKLKNMGMTPMFLLRIICYSVCIYAFIITFIACYEYWYLPSKKQKNKIQEENQNTETEESKE